MSGVEWQCFVRRYGSLTIDNERRVQRRAASLHVK